VEKNKIVEFIKVKLGLLILAAAVLYSVVSVAYSHLTFEAPNVTTVKIAHWQLEAGFRESLTNLIDDYEKLYKDKTGKEIRIIQMPISEKGYAQFINSSLIGGVAPDIIEQGIATTATDVSYIARYFEPLGAELDKPNPYNAGTDLEKIPWRQTFFDALLSRYQNELQDYYTIPFSMFTTRIFYNKNMLFQVSGKNTPPKSFTELMDTFKQLDEYNEKNGTRYLGIAGSKEQKGLFANWYQAPFFADTIAACDFNMDNTCDEYEAYIAFKKHKWSFQDENRRLSFKCLMELTEHFPVGWQALNREDSLFQFVQGNGLMLASGSWNASSITRQVADRFELGIFDFPMVADHPEYGKYAKSQTSEAGVGGGINWEVNSHSANKELAIDFLKFCTTRKNNERFNGDIIWLPVIQGATSKPILKPFTPRLDGYPSLTFKTLEISPEANLLSEGLSWSLFAGRLSLDEYLSKCTELYEKNALQGYHDKLDILKRRLKTTETIANADLALLMYGDNKEVSVKTAERLGSAQGQSLDISTNEGRLREVVNGEGSKK